MPMSRKTLIWIGMFVGSTTGAYLPSLWGSDGLVSISSIVFSTIGALAGIWAGWKAADFF
jgi:hypothetical protein